MKGKRHAGMLESPIVILKSRSSVTIPRDNRVQFNLRISYK